MEGSCPSLLYFAYGEHMNENETLREFPAARMVGLTKLSGFSLCFVGKDGKARPALAPHPEGSVPGRVWSLCESNLDALDRLADHPYSARREVRQVTLYGMKLPVLIYITVPGQQKGRPGFLTYDLIREAYEKAGENIETLKVLAAKCVPLG